MEMHGFFLALGYWVLGIGYWVLGNVPEKKRNEFHAKGATIAKRGYTGLQFTGGVVFQECAKNNDLTPPQFHQTLLLDPTLATFAPVALKHLPFISDSCGGYISPSPRPCFCGSVHPHPRPFTFLAFRAFRGQGFVKPLKISEGTVSLNGFPGGLSDFSSESLYFRHKKPQLTDTLSKIS